MSISSAISSIPFEYAYHGKRVLVTGVTGFIGQHLLSSLQLVGAEVSVVVRSACSLPYVNKEFVGDISSSAFMQEVMQGCSPEVIFHLAGTRARMVE
jgi:nucleoside-diphosphate-sugar epimerase